MTTEVRLYNGVNTVSSINGVGRTGLVHAKNETRPPTYTVHKNNSICIKDLNISCDTIKVLEENIGGKISDMPHSNIFANISPRVREIKGKNKQMGLHQTKKFLHG